MGALEGAIKGTTIIRPLCCDYSPHRSCAWTGGGGDSFSELTIDVCPDQRGEARCLLRAARPGRWTRRKRISPRPLTSECCSD